MHAVIDIVSGLSNAGLSSTLNVYGTRDERAPVDQVLWERSRWKRYKGLYLRFFDEERSCWELYASHPDRVERVRELGDRLREAGVEVEER